jgi:hypothetical protein
MVGFAGRKITIWCEFCTALCANIKQENFFDYCWLRGVVPARQAAVVDVISRADENAG